MAVKEKKRVQVQIDKELADNTEAVLSQLGLNPTTAINMFYKRIVADAALPFKPALSEAERANLSLLKTTKETPVTEFKDAKEVADWLNDPDED
ncbi:type II toxin-antitoxin system RelB/DinJ family antitoxin (plasmid) [Lactiplantibacillus pentosus]|uniref:type II toxin-antitoxin system RelB/DinJ family antitoxin n=1 Tax=Lactiplantibacillus pentosus TaxID=1589 RepID=UPI0034D4D9FF